MGKIQKIAAMLLVVAMLFGMSTTVLAEDLLDAEQLPKVEEPANVEHEDPLPVELPLPEQEPADLEHEDPLPAESPLPEQEQAVTENDALLTEGTVIEGPTVIRDSDSPTGYTVQFVYKNENAQSVTFAGDIGLINWADPTDKTVYTPFEYKPGLMRSGAFTAPMVKLAGDQGYWYYEVPLAAGANQYWFYVDGNTRYMVPDPANRPIWSPNSPENKNAYNAVYVPYDEKQNFEPMEARTAELPRADEQKGRWSYVPISFDGNDHYMGVYLPYGYDENRAEPYKTIYILHGSGQDESDWMGIGSVANILDNLIAEDRTEPAVLISLTSNKNMIGSQWGGDGKYDNLTKKIIPFVESTYNVSTEAQDRSFGGLSMGSMNTQALIDLNPNVFGYYGAWSGGMRLKTEVRNLNQIHIFFGGGSKDTGNPGAASMSKLNGTGVNYAYQEVAGAHDFNAWCQLFRIYAEDYLWKPAEFTKTNITQGPSVIKKESSPTGYTVQFVYKNETAKSVTFAGDIGLINWKDPTDTKAYTPFEYKPGLMRSGSFTAPMQKVEGYEGYWFYEVPMAAGANQYWFYVDGNTTYMVPDPANPPKWSPNSDKLTKNAYNAVYVPYDVKQGFEPMEARKAELPRTDEKKGTWSYETIRIDNNLHYMGVYLPYGYDKKRAEPYKTIYMLHGGGQDESDWMGIGSVQNILDNLIAEGRTEPAVLISLTSNNNMIGSQWGGDGKYLNLTQKVIPFIEAQYNVSTEAQDRSLAGLSMGSMNTQALLSVNAAAFGYYGPWSGGMRVDVKPDSLKDAHLLFGAGNKDFGNPGAASMSQLKGTGANYDFAEVAGAHDFNAWCQLFRIYAEKYLWKPAAFNKATPKEGPTVFKDNGSPTGYTVRFVYKNAAAETVTFAGDIALVNWANPTDTKVYTPFEYKAGLMRSGSFTAPMQKMEGFEEYWFYDVPLAAGANQYWFYVDGDTTYMVPDPANPPIWSDSSLGQKKNAYNAVYVPYDKVQNFAPMEARKVELPRSDNKKGTWSYVPITVDGKTQYMGVYLPFGYDEKRAEPYKTIYMLHGGGQDESDWLGIGSVQNILDNLNAEKLAEPAVLVSLTSNNNCIGNAKDGFSNLFKEIIPFVEKTYHVSTKSEDRSLAGLSMGGGNTLGVIKAASDSVNYNGKFGYYGSFSSSNTNDGFSGIKVADNTRILFGCGRADPFERRKPTAATLAELSKLGAYIDYVEVAGAHDFNAWCQLFTVYVRDYLWKPEAFSKMALSPKASPAADTTYYSAQMVTLTAEDGADIYYTTDGSIPTTGSTKYTGPFNVGVTTTVKAVAVKAGLMDSAVASFIYTIQIGGGSFSNSSPAPKAGAVTKLPTATATATEANKETAGKAQAAVDKMTQASADKTGMSIKAVGPAVTIPEGLSSLKVTLIKLPDSVDVNKITAMAVLNSDGTLTAVPTRINADGTVTALVKSGMTLVPLNAKVGLTDLSQDANVAGEINKAIGLMIIESRGNGIFDPNTAVTAQETVTMFLRAIGVPVEFSSAIATGAAHGLVDANTVPSTVTTRIDAANMIVKVLKDVGMKPTLSAADTDTLLAQFSDLPGLSADARQAMAICVKLGIFRGYGNDKMGPQDTLTRAQIASLSVRMQNIILG